MTKRHMALSGALIITLLLTACNPIPPEPSPLTTPPALPHTPAPMHADLYDFAFAFTIMFDEEIEPEVYADVISKISDCMRSHAPDDVEDPSTPGQTAALQWVAILFFVTNMDSQTFEKPIPDLPNMYDRLVFLHEFCMEGLRAK